MIDHDALAGQPRHEAASFPTGFHEDDELRSRFMRRLILCDGTTTEAVSIAACGIPKVLVRFWHDAGEVPADVQECLDSWSVLETSGFEVTIYDDVSAAAYISEVYGAHHAAAFARCGHPAMRSDFFRLCYMLASGGFYVDADDVLTDGFWPLLYGDDRLKLNPLGYVPRSGGNSLSEARRGASAQLKRLASRRWGLATGNDPLKVVFADTDLEEELIR